MVTDLGEQSQHKQAHGREEKQLAEVHLEIQSFGVCWLELSFANILITI